MLPEKGVQREIRLASRCRQTSKINPRGREECGVAVNPHRVAPGQDVTPTFAYLRMRNDRVADQAADYMVECREAGDFDNLEEWLSDKIDYFR
jgi:hypothetical protein